MDGCSGAAHVLVRRTKQQIRLHEQSLQVAAIYKSLNATVRLRWAVAGCHLSAVSRRAIASLGSLQPTISPWQDRVHPVSRPRHCNISQHEPLTLALTLLPTGPYLKLRLEPTTRVHLMELLRNSTALISPPSPVLPRKLLLRQASELYTAAVAPHQRLWRSVSPRARLSDTKPNLVAITSHSGRRRRVAVRLKQE